MNELFEQSNMRAKFTPSRLGEVQNNPGLKADEYPFAEHVDNVKRVG